jgi:hypothetical protein
MKTRVRGITAREISLLKQLAIAPRSIRSLQHFYNYGKNLMRTMLLEGLVNPITINTSFGVEGGLEISTTGFREIATLESKEEE